MAGLKLRVAIIVDPMGCMAATPEKEVEEHKERFTGLLAPCQVEFYQAMHPGEGIKHGLRDNTDLVIYDFGGMLMGCDDLLRSNARSLIRWCQNHQYGLVLVVSEISYRDTIRYELEDLGLDLPNLVHFERDSELPQWFRDLHKITGPPEEEPRTATLASQERPAFFKQDVEQATIPNQKFFRPTRKFLDWLAKKAGDGIVIDCGCGVGHLTAALTERGVKAIGIDINPREAPETTVVPVNARTFNYPKGCIAVFARPCHSDWVYSSVKQASKTASSILYIGLEKNVRDDLGDLYYEHFRKTGKNAGKDGEFVWQWSIL